MVVVSSSSRLKREDCKRTRHDSVFSRWEILIGSSDWEDYSLGKDGVQKYRIHNLSNNSSCPGLYELGIAAISADEGRKSRKHAAEKVIVVYLGQTNNVRTRLQRYGRVGAHLESGKLDSSLNENECRGLFTEIFLRGYSIMFRWAPMIGKKEAEKKEAELLAVFDYAWNTCANGTCRQDEIVSKLDSKTTTPIKTAIKKHLLWKHPSFSKKTGINIDSSVPYNEQKGFLLPKVLKFGKSQLHFINKHNSLEDEANEICGVALGDGSVCKSKPIFGRKRCEEHKGKKILGTTPSSSHRVIEPQESSIICGVTLEDGTPCAKLPSYGKERCEAHKGRRITKLEFNIKPHIELYEKCEPHEVHGICGASCNDGTVCRKPPIWGRKRCMDHKGQRVTRINVKSSTSEEDWAIEEGDICGFFIDGRVCKRKPVSGRKRCEEHKGQRITVMLSNMSTKSLEQKDNLFVCGVGLVDGSRCRNSPVRGRKRCELHKGMRVS